MYGIVECFKVIDLKTKGLMRWIHQPLTLHNPSLRQFITDEENQLLGPFWTLVLSIGVLQTLLENNHTTTALIHCLVWTLIVQSIQKLSSKQVCPIGRLLVLYIALFYNMHNSNVIILHSNCTPHHYYTHYFHNFYYTKLYLLGFV